MACILQSFTSELNELSNTKKFGFIESVRGLLVEVTAPYQELMIGKQALILTNPNPKRAEIVGVRGNTALMMVFGSSDGICAGQRVDFLSSNLSISPTKDWIGRIINSFGEPIDGGPPLTQGEEQYNTRAAPPHAAQRGRIGNKIDLGIRSINTFLTCCAGQRMGIFAGSGIGKSVLLSMITRFTTLDVIVIGLIGERGREVQEFIQDNLGEEGLKRSIVVVATAGEPALIRKQAAYLTLTLAEYLADQGLNVLCLMDSITRFAAAQREIGLSVGEPPTTKGYPPSVFSELPRLLERAGPTINGGTITGLFTILVEADDHNEPISDAVRAILDGHIVLDRSLAEREHFPAINVLRSLSRTMPNCNNQEERTLIAKAKNLLATYSEMAELIKLGAYKLGSDAGIDEAIFYQEKLSSFLKQEIHERSSLEESYLKLKEIFSNDENS